MAALQTSGKGAVVSLPPAPESCNGMGVSHVPQQKGIVMRKKIIYMLLAAALYPFVGMNYTVKADEPPIKFAQSGMPFLKIDVGGRAALAGTQIGVVGDAASMFYNPAGLAMVTGLDATLSLNQWIADITHTGAAAAFRAGNLGTFGVSFVTMNYGDFTSTIATDVTQDPTRAGYRLGETFTVTEYAVGVSYGRQISSEFSVGGHIRYAYQNLGTNDVFNEISGKVDTDVEQEVSNIVVDFGTLYYPGFKDFRFGMSLRNFSNQSDYYDQRFELPLSFDFGVAMDVLSLFAEGGSSKLTVAFDWIHPREYDERQHLGVEFSLLDMLFLRGGYKFNYDEEGLSAGVGVEKAFGPAGLKVDFTYTDFGIFDSVTRISVGVFLP